MFRILFLLFFSSVWAGIPIAEVDRAGERILLENGALYGAPFVPADWRAGQTVLVQQRGERGAELYNERTHDYIQASFLGAEEQEALRVAEMSLSNITLGDGSSFFVPFDSLIRWREGDPVQVDEAHERFSMWNMLLTNLARSETVRAQRR